MSEHVSTKTAECKTPIQEFRGTKQLSDAEAYRVNIESMVALKAKSMNELYEADAASTDTAVQVWRSIELLWRAGLQGEDKDIADNMIRQQRDIAKPLGATEEDMARFSKAAHDEYISLSRKLWQSHSAVNTLAYVTGLLSDEIDKAHSARFKQDLASVYPMMREDLYLDN